MSLDLHHVHVFASNIDATVEWWCQRTLRREHGTHPGTVEEHEIASWLAIRDVVVEWFCRGQGTAEVVH